MDKENDPDIEDISLEDNEETSTEEDDEELLKQSKKGLDGSSFPEDEKYPFEVQTVESILLEKEREFEKKLRFARNQMNIATAFSKEGAEVTQILKYAKEARSLFRELLYSRPENLELLALQKKAERIVIMCTYSSSQLDDLLLESKKYFEKAIEEMELEHELQARWNFEISLEKIRPLIIVWGVTPETKQIVEAVSSNLETLDQNSVLGDRREDEPRIFELLDRLTLIKDTPLMETLNDTIFRELLGMKEYFIRLEEQTGVKGLQRLLRDIDSELYHIYSDKIRTALGHLQNVNLMERTADFGKIEDILSTIRILKIDDDRRDFILKYAGEIKSKYLKTIKQMGEVRKLLEQRGEILRSTLDDLPRADRLERLLSEVDGIGFGTAYRIKNRNMILRIANLLEENKDVPGKGTDELSGSETGGTLTADKKDNEETNELLQVYKRLPSGSEKDSINGLLDSITADLIYDTTRYTPTKVTINDDVEGIIESLNQQIKSLIKNKAYLPFGKERDRIDKETEKRIQSKPETRPETRPVKIPENELETRSAKKPVSKPQTGQVKKPENELETRSAKKPVSKPETGPVKKPENELETRSAKKPESKPETRPEKKVVKKRIVIITKEVEKDTIE